MTFHVVFSWIILTCFWEPKCVMGTDPSQTYFQKISLLSWRLLRHFGHTHLVTHFLQDKLCALLTVRK